MSKISINLLCAILVSSLLYGCGGGGGGDDVPDTRSPGTLEGVAHDAPLINAPVKVYAWDSGAKGELLGSGTTGPDGDYELTITSPSRPVLVVAGDGGSYVEEASGVSVSLVSGQSMSAITNYESGKKITVQVTPFTHLAACYAEYLLGQGDRVVDAITVSNSMVSSLVGVEIIRTKPLDVTNPSSANYDLTPGHKYGFLTAGISEAMSYISEQNGLAAHSQRHLTSIHFANVACNDIRADGLLDGVGYYDSASTGISDLAFGTYDIDPDTYRTLVAQKMLAFTRNTRNASTLDVSDLLTFANALSTSTDPVWAGTPGSPVDDTGPSIAASLAEGSYISGTESLAFTVDDPVGVETVRFYVDNAFVDNGDTASPVLTLNTTTYGDGDHVIAVEADDKIGNTSRKEYTYNIDNSGPSVVFTTPNLVGDTAYSASGTWSSPGADIATITVNGVNADILNDGTWNADITLSSGTNLVTVVSFDSVGNTSSQEFTVSVDLVKPVITNQPSSVSYTTYQGQYNLCDLGTIEDPLLPNPVCVRTDRVSLNGLSVNGNLSNLEYVQFAVRVEDPSGASVYTDFDDLSVQYQYLVNGTVAKDWAPLDTGLRATQPGTNYGWFYLPMVTEFFGDNWYQTLITDVHEIKIEVSDSVGNKNNITYRVSFDVLVYADSLRITASSDAESVLTKSFANRFDVDGQSVHLTTTVENLSDTPFYFSLAASSNHAAMHTYESAIRKNRARLVSEEKWRVDPYSYAMVEVNRLLRDGGSYIYPETSSEEFHEIFSDTLSVPSSTNWVDIDRYTCPGGAIDYYVDGHLGDFRWAACVKRQISPAEAPNYFSFQHRYIYSAEYEAGYPRNEIATHTTDYSVTDDGVVVWNVTENRSADADSGYYIVPPNSEIEVRRVLRLPTIFHYNDSEVGDLASFGSYETKYFDKETSWTLDGGLTLEILGSLGSSPYSIDAGSGQNTYSITRT